MSVDLSSVNKVRAASNLLTKLLHDGEKRRDAVVSAADAILFEEAGAILKEIDIEEINRGKQGIRVSTLKAAGFATVYDLVKTSLPKLKSLPGIGEQTARKITAAAEQIAADAKGSCDLKLTADNKDARSTALVKALYLYRRVRAPYTRAKEISAATAEAVAAASVAVRPLEGFFSRLFLRDAKRAEAENALEYFNAMASSTYLSDIKALNKEMYTCASVTDSAAWAEFEQEAASYWAILDELGLSRIDATRNGLPEELAREVEQVPLDLTGLKCTLRSYQYFGVQYVLNRGAVLLGDEMGLGKTVQAIAAMVALRQAGKTHFLVVAPASVLINWSREVAQHSDLTPIRIHGDIHTAINQWLREGGVGIATYESISSFALPAGFTYGLLVADEAHYVKNPSALRTRSLVRLRKQAERVLFMTGTPLENNVDEMCFLISQLQPDIEKKVRSMRLMSTAPKFREEVAPVYFRRTREDVLKELPELIEKEEWCAMTASEAADHLGCAVRKEFAAMRQVSWREQDIKNASKAKRLVELCEEAKADGRKVLVFSFFLNTLSQVKSLLGDTCYGPVTGAVAPQRRQEIVDAFTAAEPGAVLAAQIQAGGTGLNIQAASVVILCEPQLKPSIENQAISRAYRMGQVRSVLVHRLLCENSIDERIMDLLAAKQEIFDNFAEESVSGNESLTGDVDALLTLSEKDCMQAMEDELLLLGGTAGPDADGTLPEDTVIALPPKSDEADTPGDDISSYLK